MKIGVIGCGYVGLVTGVCFAEAGNKVVVMDIDAAKVAKLSEGIPTFYELGVDAYLRRNLKDGRLSFTTRIEDVAAHGTLIFLCVGTPPKNDGEAELRHLFSAVEDLARHLQGYKIIVTKSTVPVGTNEEIRKRVAALTDEPFDVASNPEFLREGRAIQDFNVPDRVVFGVDNPAVGELLRELYLPFTTKNQPILITDLKTAEMIKYAANAMLATKISFINEIANICDLVGADIDLVRQGIGSDERIGFAFLHAGSGYGGSCFPKDVPALSFLARKNAYQPRLLEAVHEVNKSQKLITFRHLNKVYDGDLKGKKIGIWGLSFKKGTSDVREAASIPTIAALLEAGAQVSAHDPEAMDAMRLEFPEHVNYCESPYDACQGADALLLLSDWRVYGSPDFDELAAAMRTPLIIDGKNLFCPRTARRHGFTYYGVGRPQPA